MFPDTPRLIRSSADAADAYLVAATDEMRTQMYIAIQEWAAFEFEQEGKSVEEIDRLDLASLADQMIRNRQGG